MEEMIGKMVADVMEEVKVAILESRGMMSEEKERATKDRTLEKLRDHKRMEAEEKLQILSKHYAQKAQMNKAERMAMYQKGMPRFLPLLQTIEEDSELEITKPYNPKIGCPTLIYQSKRIQRQRPISGQDLLYRKKREWKKREEKKQRKVQKMIKREQKTAKSIEREEKKRIKRRKRKERFKQLFCCC